jgi:hypothetical protein
MILCYRGCKYRQPLRLQRIVTPSALKNIRTGKYRGVSYKFYRSPETGYKLKYRVRYRGAYVRSEGIDLDLELMVAAAQIQKTIERLQESGMSLDEARDNAVKQIVAQVRRNPYKKKDLLVWGQSLDDPNLDELVKTTVNRAIISVVSSLSVSN